MSDFMPGDVIKAVADFSAPLIRGGGEAQIKAGTTGTVVGMAEMVDGTEVIEVVFEGFTGPVRAPVARLGN